MVVRAHGESPFVAEGATVAPSIPTPPQSLPSAEVMFAMPEVGKAPESSLLEIEGAAATEVVVIWKGSVVGVKHFPHESTYSEDRAITTRGETALAGACMVAGGVVFGPALGKLVGRIWKHQVLPKERSYTIGEDPASDLPVMSELLDGQTRFAFVETDARGARINTTAAMTGEIAHADGSRVSTSELPGSSFELPTGAKARLELGEFTFLISTVSPGRIPVAASDGDWNAVTFVGFSLLVHAVFLFLVYFVPPDPSTLSLDSAVDSNRFARYLVTAPELQQQDNPDWTVRDQSEAAGGSGQRHADANGEMGDREAKRTTNHFGVKEPRDNPNPRMARDLAKEAARESGILAVLRAAAPTSPFGADTPLGNDPENALGALMGNEYGSNFGYGSLGDAGTGRGGGGDGRGTSGLGNLPTVGRGAGGGPGSGYGPGGFGGPGGPTKQHVMRGPEVATGVGSVRGGLAQDVIRRYIRRNIAQIRHCYERELAGRPDLAGRVQVRFVITGSGAVSTSAIASTTMGNASVEQCVARAVQRISFPSPEDNGVVVVTYPFMFRSAN